MNNNKFVSISALLLTIMITIVMVWVLMSMINIRPSLTINDSVNVNIMTVVDDGDNISITDSHGVTCTNAKYSDGYFYCNIDDVVSDNDTTTR